MRHRETHGREARALVNDPRDHLPQRQFSCTGRAQGLVDPSASGDLVYGPHRTKRHALFQRDRVLDGPKVLQRLLVPQCKAHGLDLCLGTMTRIRNGAMEDLAVGAIRLAQQMPRIGFATTSDTRGIDIHSGYYNSIFKGLIKGYFRYKLIL